MGGVPSRSESGQTMSAEQRSPSGPPVSERFTADVRVAALRLVANARSGEYLAGVAHDTITHKQALMSDILQFLAAFGYEAMRQIHGDLAARFIGDELDTAEFAQLLDHLEWEVSEWDRKVSD